MRLFLLPILLLITLALSAQTSFEHIVYFDFGKDVPDVISKQKLDEFIASLKSKSIERVQINGYTDKIGSVNYNLELSNRRAENIKKYLQSILSAQILLNVKYFGKDSLLSVNDTNQEINRRVGITFFLPYGNLAPIADNQFSIEPFVEDVQEQIFKINLDDTVSITGKEGTIIKIAPGSVQNKKGALMKGMADLVLKEYYEPGDIILAGLNTVSDQGSLQTGGMFYMTIISGMDSMSPETLKPVEIRIPKKDKSDSAMNVFIIKNHNKVNSWEKTNDAFHQLIGYWEWPQIKKSEYWIKSDFAYENLKIGNRDTINQDFSHFDRKIDNKYWQKKIYEASSRTQIERLDSNILVVTTQIHYNRRGIKKFKIKDFDTSFRVGYHRAEYQVSTSNINWINCDRFLNKSKNTELYVSTPNSSGATIMVYFKRLNAFMPAYWKGEGCQLNKIPIQEPVTVIAFGKNDNGYYFGKQDYTIVEKGLVNVVVENLSADDFHKKMKQL